MPLFWSISKTKILGTLSHYTVTGHISIPEPSAEVRRRDDASWPGLGHIPICGLRGWSPHLNHIDGKGIGGAVLQRETMV